MNSGLEKRTRIAWIVWFTILVISAYVVPYALIGHIASPYASFLYWILFAAAAIVSIIVFMQRWGDQE